MGELVQFPEKTEQQKVYEYFLEHLSLEFKRPDIADRPIITGISARRL